MNLETSLKTDLNPVSKSALKTLTKYLVLTLGSLLLSLASLVLVSLTLLIKWLLVTIVTMAGKLRMLRQKINQYIYTRIN